MKSLVKTTVNGWSRVRLATFAALVAASSAGQAFAQATGIDTAAATAVLTDNKEKLIAVAVVVFGIAALIMILRKIGAMFSR